MKKIALFSEVPEEYYIAGKTYRGILEFVKKRKPSHPNDIEEIIYLLEEVGENKKGEEQLEYIKYQVDLSSEEVKKNLPSASSTEDSLTKKRNRLLNIKGINFHFLDFTAIRHHYEKEQFESKGFKLDYDIIVKKLRTEISNQNSSGLSIQLPKLIEGFFKDENNAKYISEFEFKLMNHEDMFIEYQSKRINNNSIVLNLEMKEVESKELKEFDSTVSTLTNKYGFGIVSEEIQRRRRKIENAIVDEIVNDLTEREDQHIIVFANFTIESLNENYFKLSYNHPLNPNTQLVVRIQKEKLSKDWKDRYELQAIENGSFSLYVYGSILDTSTITSEKKRIILIYPIAIYML